MSNLFSRRRSRALVLATAVALTVFVPGVAHASALRFAAPVFVDRTLAGGEPSVAYAVKSGLLVYSSHEGTTHLFTSNLLGAPAESGGFITGYHNQVNIWYSSDGGRKWTLVPFGSKTNPYATGFSDPDLTQDANGNIYNTGIDLANDALFSSQNGGRTWPTGTANCHEGDRPWLAGGKANEVFLSTDTQEAGHIIYHSTNAGRSCSSTGIPDNGTVPKKKKKLFHGQSYQGQGKLYYDRRRGSVVEPVLYVNPKTSRPDGVGIGILRHASRAFKVKHPHVIDIPIGRSTVYSHWPAMAIDSRGNYYMVWDTDTRSHRSRHGCPASYSGSESAGSVPPVNAYTPTASSVLMSYSTDGGLHWSRPRAIAHQPGHRLLWPWVTAGSAGRIGVVWYRYNRVVDPDCAPSSAHVVVMAAELSHANSRHPHKTMVNASGRSIHSGSTCAGGTECAADNFITKEDRRLGDYFTDSIDRRGCLIIATGDTTRRDPVTGMPSPISYPLFLHQNGGTGLLGKPCGARASRKPRRTQGTQGFTG